MGFERLELTPQEIEEALPAPAEEIVHMKNDLQMKLVARSHDGKTELEEHFNDWLNKNYLKFRIVFNELRYNNPNLLEDYKNDCDNLLELIQNKMDSLPELNEEMDPFRAAA